MGNYIIDIIVGVILLVVSVFAIVLTGNIEYHGFSVSKSIWNDDIYGIGAGMITTDVLAFVAAFICYMNRKGVNCLENKSDGSNS